MLVDGDNRETSVDFGGSGSTDTVARSDHDHDETYAKQVELEKLGGQLVHWKLGACSRRAERLWVESALAGTGLL